MKKYRTVWMAILQWGLIWSVLIGASMAWNQHLIGDQINLFARREARSVIQKDLAFRRWVTMQGGVYVRPTKETPPNPWLIVPKRDVTTTDGDALTLMNPAYVTRQVMELYDQQYGVKGHITSQFLKNPSNAPDPWEEQALKRFEQGEEAVREFVAIDGVPYYRLILPMKMEQGCLKCHADTKIPVGGIRGGISTAVPLTSYQQAAAKNRRGNLLAHGMIWLAGMFGITIASMIYHRQQQRERKAEDELRAQEALYASLTTSSPTGVFQTDLQGGCCYVNNRWSTMSGLSFEQSLGSGWISTLHPDDLQKVSDEWQKALDEQRSFSLEYRFKRPDGLIVWVFGQTAKIFDTKGAVTGYVGTLTDITASKKSEAELADSTLFLRESQSIARLGGWKSNPQTDMLFFTEETRRMLEHPDSDPISHAACFRYFDPQDLPLVQQCLQDAIENGTPFKLNCRLISASGWHFWGDFRCVGRLEGPDGSYLAGTIQDISEHKQLEELLTSAKEAAEATSRAKTELLGALSHELRTPLNGVIGGVQLLEMTELSDEQDEYLKMVKSSANNELVLVNDLLDLAGLEFSGMKIQSKPFNLLDSISLSASLHRSSLESRGLSFSTILSDSLNVLVMGDGQRLAQITNNLLSNAIKFTEVGQITLIAELVPYGPGELRLKMQVCDSGIGIPPREQERIFDPFMQVDMSSTRKFGGTGLGLAISRKLVDRMGGSLQVASTPGEGSCFRLELPFLRAGATTDSGETVLSALWHGPALTVLIAEDNSTNLKAVAGLVTKMGLKVLCAEDGKQALAHWMAGGVDLILMDIQMPIMDGREATSIIRQQEHGKDRQTPIIALTAHAMVSDRARLLSEGFDGYVAKPFQLPELVKEMAWVTRGKNP